MAAENFFVYVFLNIRRNVALSKWIPHALYENYALSAEMMEEL
jgi:hypothetical protein